MGRPERVSRGEVLKAAREAFSQRGYEGTTLAAIGARLGVSPAALLRHAPDKESLFRAALAEGRASGPGVPALFEGLDPSRPEEALRRLAGAWIPFVEASMGLNIVQWMRAARGGPATALRLSFDPRSEESPPRQFLSLLEKFLARARKAGTVRVGNPRAAALAFLGNLQAYVFLHRVARIEPAVPLDLYLDTVFDIWRRGALRAEGRRK